MPKHEIKQSPGHHLDPKIQSFLSEYFKEDDLQRLERLGGRILISIAPAYTMKRKKGRKPVDITAEFLKELERQKSSPEKIREILDSLLTKELKQLCQLMRLPIRSNTDANTIRTEISKFLYAEDFWNSISGKK